VNSSRSSTSPTSFDLEAVARWLQDAAPGVAAPVEATLIAGGRSNLTYKLATADGRRLVLRRPPTGPLQSSAHDMQREYTILEALYPTPIPVPAPLAYCADPSLIGAPFYVMEFVGGATIAGPEAADALPLGVRQRLAEHAVDVLARLHAVDVETTGLGGLARPGSYLERQLSRWSRQLDGYPELTSDLLRPVERELRRGMPAAQRTVLTHGDYKLGNLRAGEDGAVLAVLDWELTAVGDPLADLGWLLASWAEPRDPGQWIVAPPTLAGGFPSRGALAQRYAERSGLDLERLDYYVAFAYWRWSCINEGILTRVARGALSAGTVQPGAVRAQIRWQLDRAWTLLNADGSDASAAS
jgi:aminoglycoside phosphotransferase (APT) family kinase protein